jgi:catechol 2,3-dioxygenase-like lactoylglutathione lyase family enzyme
MNLNDNNQTRSSFRIENIVPILLVKDMAVSRSFYKDILGFSEADWGSDNFTNISRDNSGIYLSKGEGRIPGTLIWIGFDGDIFALYNQLTSRGVTIKQPPVNYSWALEMEVEDPDGHILRFGTEPNPNEPFRDSATE